MGSQVVESAIHLSLSQIITDKKLHFAAILCFQVSVKARWVARANLSGLYLLSHLTLLCGCICSVGYCNE